MNTTKMYHAQLPPRNYRIVRPVPMPRPRPTAPGVEEMEAKADQIREKLRRKIDAILLYGAWHCHDCDSFCERIEDDHGQPAHCHRCRSHKLYLVGPLKEAK
ncbi:MAG: hypothetical protein ACREE6_11395 [Limisphaerales bacterium]